MYTSAYEGLKGENHEYEIGVTLSKGEAKQGRGCGEGASEQLEFLWGCIGCHLERMSEVNLVN